MKGPLFVGGRPINGDDNPWAKHWYVNTVAGSGAADGYDGDDPRAPLLTMTEAFTRIGSGDIIHLRGGVYENLTTPAGVNDVTIRGESTKPRHDHLTDATKKGAACWKTASDVTDEPLLIVRTQGWRVENLLIAPPSGEAGIQLLRDTTYDASHFSAIGCRFAQTSGKYAITNNGGAGFVGLYGNWFQGMATAAILCLTTAIAVPLMWDIQDNFFGYANASHILSSASHWRIKNNEFMTVAAEALYIDLTYNSGQGLANVVTKNLLAGGYDTADYIGSATDDWTGNFSADVAEAEVGDNGITILPPAA